jgi:hypothetical protein
MPEDMAVLCSFRVQRAGENGKEVYGLDCHGTTPTPTGWLFLRAVNNRFSQADAALSGQPHPAREKTLIEKTSHWV